MNPTQPHERNQLPEVEHANPNPSPAQVDESREWWDDPDSRWDIRIEPASVPTALGRFCKEPRIDTNITPDGVALRIDDAKKLEFWMRVYLPAELVLQWANQINAERMEVCDLAHSEDAHDDDIPF